MNAYDLMLPSMFAFVNCFTEAESIGPWWKPLRPLIFTRLRLAFQKNQRIFYNMHSDPVPNENIIRKEAV